MCSFTAHGVLLNDPYGAKLPWRKAPYLKNGARPKKPDTPEHLRERYPPGEWNIYAAQASDGDNFSGDAEKCIALLDSEVMPLCQYYAYVEILDEREMELFQDPDKGTALWQAYRAVGTEWANFEMKRIAGPGDIYPVFRELFAKQVADG